ncbi:MAG: DUF4388 domain-containing protein [Candidatus Dadabacteria bacterium]|nr:MAG: DUF4388 domain-containing protein [Candidatus Dadabacteria bacterium]
MNSVSLAGSLQDLGLNDILQILSLSRKSGTLRLRYRDLGLELYVLHGGIVAARPHPSISTLHRFFTERGLLDAAQQDRFIQLLRDKDFEAEPWTPFWSSVFGKPAETIAEWARDYILWLVTRAAAWDEGEFSFELDPDGTAHKKLIRVPVFPSVEQPISAEYIAIEGARLADENAASRSGLDADVGDQTIAGYGIVAEAERASADAATAHILFVDPKRETVERVAQSLRDAGFPHVAVASSVDGAIETIERAAEAPWTVVCELVMPKRDRSGVLGGLEVAQALSDHERVRATYLCTDLVNDEIRSQADQAGVAGLIMRPARKAWKTSFDDALHRYVAAISEAIGAPPEKSPEAAAALDDINDADRFEISLDDPLAALLDSEDLHLPVPQPRTDRGVHLLRQMIEELVNPNAESEISLLILRFAADFFQRSILFAVSGKTLAGLGQTGLSTENADRIVRELRIPVIENTVVSRVLSTRQTYTGAVAGDPQLEAMLERLGGPHPTEILLAPVLAGDRIVAMLYADQVPTQSRIENVETVEIFLAQAGLALERTYLMRQLRQSESGQS